jgi:hypothetical protein
LQPRFDVVGIGVAEMGCEAVSSSFYLFENTFDAGPIAVCDVSKSEPAAVEGSLQSRRAVDEEFSVAHVVFFAKTTEKQFCHCCRSRRKQPDVKGSGCVRIDSVDESSALVREPEVTDFW